MKLCVFIHFVEKPLKQCIFYLLHMVHTCSSSITLFCAIIDLSKNIIEWDHKLYITYKLLCTHY